VVHLDDALCKEDESFGRLCQFMLENSIRNRKFRLKKALMWFFEQDDFLKFLQRDELNYDMNFTLECCMEFREVIKACVINSSGGCIPLPQSLSQDRELALLSVEHDTSNMGFYFLPDQWKNDREFILKAAHLNLDIINFNKHGSDKEVMMRIVSLDGYYLNRASEELKDDEDVVFQAVKSVSSAVQYASPRLRANKNFVLKLVNLSGDVLDYCYELTEDAEVLLEGFRCGFSGSTLKNSEITREMAMELAKRHPRFLPKRFKSDKEVAIQAVSTSGIILDIFDESLRGDLEVVTAAFISNPEIISVLDIPKEIQESIMQNRELVFSAVAKQPNFYSFAIRSYPNDKELLFHVLNTCSRGVQSVERELMCDRQVMLELIKHRCAYDIPEVLYHDTEIISAYLESEYSNNCRRILPKWHKAVEHHVELVIKALHNNVTFDFGLFTKESLLDDKELILAAFSFKNNGIRLELVSPRLRCDRDVVKQAVIMKYADQLRFADHTLTNNVEFMLEMIAISPSSFKYVSRVLVEDVNFMEAAIKVCPHLIEKAPSALSARKDIIISVVNQCGTLIKHAPICFRADKEVVMAAVKNDPLSLKYASQELKSDKEVVMEAVICDGTAIQFSSEELQEDKEVVMAAVLTGYTLDYSEKYKNDKEVLEHMVYGCDEFYIESVPDELKNDRKFFTKVLSVCGSALECASYEIQSDESMVLLAVKSFSDAIDFASEELQHDLLLNLTAAAFAKEVTDKKIMDNAFVRYAAMNQIDNPYLLG